MSDGTRYVVTGRHAGSRFTYNCPTPEWALKKLRDFVHAEYTDIVATGPDGQTVTEADLAGLVDGAASGPSVDLDVPRAPTLAA